MPTKWQKIITAMHSFCTLELALNWEPRVYSPNHLIISTITCHKSGPGNIHRSHILECKFSKTTINETYHMPPKVQLFWYLLVCKNQWYSTIDEVSLIYWAKYFFLPYTTLSREVVNNWTKRFGMKRQNTVEYLDLLNPECFC